MEQVNPLSPAAQAVLDAVLSTYADSVPKDERLWAIERDSVVAALRAAADQINRTVGVIPSNDWGNGWLQGLLDASNGLKMIATELENHQSTPDFCTLCALLADCALNHEPGARLIGNITAEQVAQIANVACTSVAPVQQRPTDEDLEKMLYFEFTTSTGHGSLVDEIGFARAVLARWGGAAPQPVPVSERLPKPEDCDEQGQCWWFNLGWPVTSNPHIATPSWRLCRMLNNKPRGSHWLPASALPQPEVEG